MRYRNVNIDVIEYVNPPEIVSSEEIENALGDVYRRLKLPFGRLELMTGIRERRFWPKTIKPSDAATLAAKKALAKTEVPKNKIGCLLMCSVCRDCLEPATASIIHNNLGLNDHCMVFDLSNACLGVLNGMIMLANMIELSQVEAGIVVAGENGRDLVNNTIKTILNDPNINRQTIKPYFASLTIGAGSVAVIMSSKSLSEKTAHSLVGGTFFTDTKYNRLCHGGKTGPHEILMHTDSEQLMQKGVAAAKKTWDLFREELGWNDHLIDCYCTHQVGNAHRKLLFETLKLDLEKNFSTLEIMGNAGSVSCPLTAAVAAEQKKLTEGNRLAMLGIGSGITCAMLGVEW